MELIIHSLEDLKKTVEALLKVADGRKKICLSGEIGAGKTALVQEFCRFFNVAEQVTSPTFSIVNEYTYSSPEDQSEQLIHHLDLYRLNDMQEAIDIGIEDYLYDGYYCLIEWPEIIESLLPEEVLKINIEILDNSSRKIIFL